MRRTPILSKFGLVCMLLLPVWVQAAPKLERAQATNTPVVRVNSADLRLNVDRVLTSQRVPVTVRQNLANRLKQLPPELQETMTAALDPSFAERVGRSELATNSPLSQITSKLNFDRPKLILAPQASSTVPATGGSRDSYCLLLGSQLNSECEVRLDNVVAPNSVWITGGIMAFKIPNTAPLGHVYQVTAHNNKLDVTSNAVTIKAVAPRGYRGVHGLRFANFGAAAIPWNVYVFVFGRLNVEFANGTHRPSAQSWYDSTFKGIGGGGNCWGMSQMSLRLRKFLLEGDTHALDRVCNNAWVKSNLSGSAWSLPWDENSKQAVQSLQCLQLVNPMASYCDAQKAAQTNKTAWTTAQTSLAGGRPTHNTLYGHAVVTFGVETDGTSNKFCFYDNNNPYSETETSGPDPNHGVTNWTSGTFAYGGYSKTRSYDPYQLMGVPTLPAGVGGDGSTDGAAATAPVRFEVPRVAGLLIQDEAGRGGADGAGVPGLIEVNPDMGLGPIPATFPRIFLLGDAPGRSLTFTVPNQGRQAQRLTCYSRGGMALVTLNGASIRAQFTQLDRPNAQVTLPDPQGSGLQELQFIAPVSAAEERQVIADSFGGLGNRAVGASLTADRSAIEVLNAAGAAPLQLRLRLQRFQPAGGTSLPALQQTVGAGQLHLLGPANWATLQAGQLRSIPSVLPANRLQIR